MNLNHLFALLALMIIAPLVLRLLIRLPNRNDHYSYRKQKALFSPAERSFLGVLDNAVGEQYRILGKVRIADVLTPETGMNRKNWQVAFNKISAKHFDYLLCDKHNLDVIAAIELDDKSHKQKRSLARDQLIEQACDCANLPLIRFEAKRSYQLDTVKGKIFEIVQPTTPNDSAQAAIQVLAHDSAL